MNQTGQQVSFSLQLDATANGYVVRPGGDASRDRYTPIAESHVFESFDTLVAHLRSRLPIYPVFTTTITSTVPLGQPLKRNR